MRQHTGAVVPSMAEAVTLATVRIGVPDMKMIQ